MKNKMKTREVLGKPKRKDFYFERYMNPYKSGTNEQKDAKGDIVKYGTHQSEKLPIKEFIPNKGMNRRQRRFLDRKRA